MVRAALAPPWSLLSVTTGLALAVACGSTSPSAPTQTASSFIKGIVAVGGSPVQGALHSGTPPAASGGPTVVVTTPNTATNGGTNVVTLIGSSPYQKIDVSISAGATPATGFIEVDLPAVVTSQEMTISFSSAIPTTSFSTQFQVIGSSGAVGPAASNPTTVVPSTQATASVVVTLAPNPAPFLADTPCTFNGNADAFCEWEFTITLQEVNGVGVPAGPATDTIVLPAPIGTLSAPNSYGPIPANGTVSTQRGLVCFPKPPCNTSFGPPGTESITWTPTDANGHALNIAFPTETLLGAGMTSAAATGSAAIRSGLFLPPRTNANVRGWR
jgi:hypothetical protein